MIIAAALAIPIFADEINDALNDTTNSTNSSLNNSGNNSSVSDNSSLNNTGNSTFTSDEFQALTETQSKLAVLISTIGSLKATYGNNTKVKGLLNALSQFEKQANRLNTEISAFMQNPSIISTESFDGRINSFVKREAALEHKVSIKQELLLKMDEKTVKQEVKIRKNSQKKQKTNKGQNK